ncbi:MAG TPA: phosphoglucosamine mutase [Acidimicrobiales bacterium]|nr:phosphoglucosamine mutase [Acidimicrobiales bacterium]
MAPARFGTDGVRGVANADLTAEVALALGRAAARVLSAPAFLVGRDTRRSGPFLQAALSAGLAAEGADVLDLGVIPTPGVAMLAAARRVPGAMVSASHNPFEDNGIKLFSDLGTKLAVEVEQAVEEELASIVEDPERPPARPTGRGVGLVAADPAGVPEYRAFLERQLEGRRLDGLRVVVDCANGAATAVAPGVLQDLGAEVTAIACAPDGANINDRCGSTQPAELARRVVAERADLGLAVDGDADRLVAVDATGQPVDGDVLLALFATDLASRGELTADTVVVTVMTNLGFRLAMAERGIAVHETPVGDRHVLAALDAQGLALGGEQSGHLVFRRRATTGDGILTGLLLADLVVRTGRPLAELAAGLVRRVPQVLVNVPVPVPSALSEAAGVWQAVADVEDRLGAQGRVVLRPSGTEPLVRVMVEAATEEQAEAAAGHLSAVVRRELAAPGP